MLAVCAVLGVEAKPTVKTIASPDGKLVVTVTVADDIRWSVEADGRIVLAPSQIAMQISDSETWGEAPRLRKAVVGKIDETVEAPLYKKAEVEDKCTTLTLQFKGDYAVEFRAYDNAAAYRFVSTRKGDYTVKDEVAEFAFEGDNNVYCSYVRGNANKSIEQQYYNSFENTYEIEPMSKMGANRLMFLPVLVDMGDRKVCITESDLMSYPGMYLYNPDGGTALKGNYAPVPDEVKQGGHNMLQGEVQTRKPYIAEVSGERSFPWRICIVADSDAELLNNDMVFLLSHPNVIGDTSWIEPGKVAWEWWNDWGLYGVDFKPGIDNRTYKYYIDFAARNGIEYVILDEGWSVNLKADLMQVIPSIDIKELVDYGKERGVGIVLWGGYWAVNRDMDNVFKYYSDLGVKGFKIDFMDRSDQWMVNYYERVAKEAADHKLLVDFHGSFKPAGLEIRYPNVLSYEGVLGMEQMGGCKPDNSLYLPFIRNAVGPMDYTPGAMISMQPEVYRSERPNSASIGTRAYQMALYTVFKSGIQMLADSPTMYYRNPECTEFIASVPVIWDESKVLEAKAGEYIIIARRSGEKWFIGAICNGKERERVFTVSLGFLDKGRSYSMTAFEDSVNSARQAMDYRMKKTSVESGDSLQIKMVRNGGWTAVLE